VFRRAFDWLDARLDLCRVALLLLIPNAALAEEAAGFSVVGEYGAKAMELVGLAAIAVWFAQHLLKAQKDGLERLADAAEAQARSCQAIELKLAVLEERTRPGAANHRPPE
jgi:hypothetical protein